MRQSRKLDHLKYTLLLSDGPTSAGFEDLALLHNCLPERSLDEVDLSVHLAGIPLAHPLIINAVTGGAPDVEVVNHQLAELARATGAAMAVGSQTAGLEAVELERTYRVARQVNPDGILFANLGSAATVAEAQHAVDMLQANALQIHLNPGQELMMTEGDRDFRGCLKRIEAIVKHVPVPVIVKETGCGIAAEQARQLCLIGVPVIDVGGAGGTNFLAIEASRSKRSVSADCLGWGIPTAISALETASAISGLTELIVSGGVRSPLDAVKALAIGGRAVALAGPIVRRIRQNGVEEAAVWLRDWLADLRSLLLLAGASAPEQLAHLPLIITGATRQWLEQRGIDLSRWGQR